MHKNLEEQFEGTKLFRKALTDRRGNRPIDSSIYRYESVDREKINLKFKQIISSLIDFMTGRFYKL